MDEVTDKEAEIIKVAYSPGYAHAENILHLLEVYKTQMPHKEAVTKLHAEVMDGDLSDKGWR